MNKRPSLGQALSLLRSYVSLYKDQNCIEVLQEYEQLKSDNKDFLAARLVVEIAQSINLEYNKAKSRGK
jgi:hypothetical protein